MACLIVFFFSYSFFNQEGEADQIREQISTLQLEAEQTKGELVLAVSDTKIA